MNKRRWKIAALIACGGVVLQTTACATLLVQQVASTVVSGLLSVVVSGILESVTNAGG